MNQLKEKYPSLCWSCKYSRRTWSVELENKGLIGCSYLLNKNIESKKGVLKRLEDRDCSDLFNFTDITEINEGWIVNKKPLDRTNSKTIGEGCAFNFQPIMKNVNNCELFVED